MKKIRLTDVVTATASPHRVRDALHGNAVMPRRTVVAGTTSRPCVGRRDGVTGDLYQQRGEDGDEEEEQQKRQDADHPTVVAYDQNFASFFQIYAPKKSIFNPRQGI
jgi:hypothetical protein